MMPDQQDTTFEFPPLAELPKQPWVAAYGPEARADYEVKRAAAIERDALSWAERMKTFPGFESVPHEVIDHFAWRISTRECDAYEEGQQHGRVAERQRGQAQRDWDHQYQINVLGGHG